VYCSQNDSLSKDNLMVENKVSKNNFPHIGQTGYNSTASLTIFCKLVSLIGPLFLCGYQAKKQQNKMPSIHMTFNVKVTKKKTKLQNWQADEY
jgi:hypothetical protein